MAAIVLPNTIQLTELTTLLGAVPYLGAKLHLCSANFMPTPTTPLATYTAAEAAWGGYAAKVVTWGAPYINQAGNVVADTIATFVQTAATPTETDYVAFLTDPTSATLLCAWLLDVPLNFSGLDAGGSLQISLGLNAGTGTNVP